MKNGIGWAVKQMQDGKRVSREDWNGNKLPPDGGVRLWISLRTPEGEKYRPYVQMRCVDNTRVPWLCSQSDLLATDWFVVNFQNLQP